MATRNEAFMHRGGIEVAMGRSANKGVVAQHHIRGLVVYPEDAAESAVALKSRLLFVGESTIRCDSYGDVIYATIVPGVTSSRQGRLFERWNHPKSIFGARDGVIHIIEAYSEGGEQYQRRLRAVRQANAIDIRLQQGPVDLDERIVLRDKTIEEMVEAGYLSSVYPERVKTSEQLVRATELDILNRPNNPRGRMIVTARRPQLIKDSLVADDILKKNRRKLSVIEAVCDLIEQDFENIARFSDDLAQNRVGTGAFNAELERYKGIVNALLSPGNPVFPKPYSELGAMVRYMLYTTHSRVDAITLSRYMDPLKAVDFANEYSAGFNALTTSDQRRNRVIAIERIIREGLDKIREQRLLEHTEDGDEPMENDEAKEVPKVKRRRTQLDRDWEWIDRQKI